MKGVRLFAPGDVHCVEVEEPRIERNNDVLAKQWKLDQSFEPEMDEGKRESLYEG